MNWRRFLGFIFILVAATAQAEEPAEPLNSDYRVKAEKDLLWMDAGDTGFQFKLVLDDRLQTAENLYVAASEYTSQVLTESWAEVRYYCQNFPPRADDFEYQVRCLRSKQFPIPDTVRQIEEIAGLAQKKFPNRVIASDIVALAANLMNLNGFLMDSIRLYKKSFELLPAHAVLDIIYSKLILAHALANPFLSPETQRQALVYFEEARKAYQNLPPEQASADQIRVVNYEKSLLHLFLFHEYPEAIHELNGAEGYVRLGADVRVFKAYAYAKNQQINEARSTLKSVDWSLAKDPERLPFLRCYVELTHRILGDDVSIRHCAELKKPQLDVLLDLTSTIVEYPLKPAEEIAIWRNFYQFFDKQLKPDVQRSLSAVAAAAEVQQGKAEVRLKDLQIKNLSLFRQFTFALAGTALVLVAMVLMALRFWYKSRSHALTMNAERHRLQNILDNIEEGIIKILPGLTLLPEDSEHLKKLLGWSDLPALSMRKLLEIFAIPIDQRELVQESLNAVLGEDTLAWEMNSSNLPADLHFDDRDIACFWQPIIDQGQVQEILLVMHDRTAVKSLERDSQKAREEADSLLSYAREIMSGHVKSAQKFIQELPSSLARIQEHLGPQGDRALALRLAHTIKGNARSLRLLHMQDKIHSLENFMQKNSGAELQQTLDEISQQASLYQAASRQLITGVSEELTSVLDAVAGCRQTLLDMLGKSAIPLRGVRVHEDVQISIEELKILQEVILHGLTNAADHGFVLPRRRGEKVEAALFEVEISEHQKGRQMLIRDNGCGINHSSVQNLAVSKGWAPNADQTWSDFLFTDGVSTTEEISKTSGRGVGLAAIRSAAEQLSGRVRLLDNDQGQGTILQLTWPLPSPRNQAVA